MRRAPSLLLRGPLGLHAKTAFSNSAYALSRSSLTTTASKKPGSFIFAISPAALPILVATLSSLSVPRPRSLRVKTKRTTKKERRRATRAGRHRGAARRRGTWRGAGDVSCGRSPRPARRCRGGRSSPAPPPPRRRRATCRRCWRAPSRAPETSPRQSRAPSRTSPRSGSARRPPRRGGGRGWCARR